MAKAPSLTFKTPLVPLSWANISGKGKLKYDPNNELDKEDSSNYIYTISCTLTKEQAAPINEQLTKFWRENKPQGATKMKYDLIKEEHVPDLDKNGKEQKDADGAIITKHTGNYTLTAKTNTVWADGKPNIVRVMRANGQPLDLQGKVIGEGSMGVVHGTIGISSFKGNEGLAFYLTAVQLKKFVEYVGGGVVEADNLGDDEGLDDLDMTESIEEHPVL